jgi:glycolate oxidase FAD binding subunit
MPVPPELTAACPDIAVAGQDEAIGRCRAQYVAAPASTQEASALLRAATGLGLSIVPRGAGRLQHWGSPPVSCDLIVDTHRLDRVVEHVPSEFLVTVQAGIRLSDLEEALAPAHQHLAILPPSRAFTGTIGGLIATNAAGSSRYRYGTLRDLLAGITAVRADGAVIRSGDVAYNADGRNLVDLFAGSYGTLGLITEATFRLHPTPQVSGSVWLPCTSPAHAARLVEMVSDPWIAPWGIDLHWPAGKPMGLAVSIDGDRQFFNARFARLHELAGRPAQPPIDTATAISLDAPDHDGLPPAVAAALLADRDRIDAELLDPPPDTGTLVRITFPPVRLAEVLTVIQATAARDGLAVAIYGSAGAGVLDVEVPAECPPTVVARFVPALRAELGVPSESGTPGAIHAVILYAPDEVRDLTDTLGPMPLLAPMQAAKDEFDPEHRMAPGRFADSA